ncbi:MAG: hypothetical protein WAK95_08715 [Desulfobacterales bacterium]
MIPVLGKKYDIDIEVMSKPKSDYLTDDYFELDLPVAPAVMVGDEIVAEGSDAAQSDIESAICRQLGLPPPKLEGKGFFTKLFKG